MSDPLSDVMQLLRPRAVFSKGIAGAGGWAVRYSEFGEPSFCAVLEGRCLLAVDGQQAVVLQAGDFVLLPTTPAFTLSSFEVTATGSAQPTDVSPTDISPTDISPTDIGPARIRPIEVRPSREPPPGHEIRHGNAEGPADVRLLGGWFALESRDPGLLASLLPALVHVRDVPRLSLLVGLVAEEASDDRPGREALLSRLVELLLVETLRRAPGQDTPPGLLRGLADARLAPALRRMHAEPAHAWTVLQLAKLAALSRSAFFERFVRTLGVAPMDYLLRWRMALARDLLRHQQLGVAATAERVGYSSASTFSTAFSRHVGLSPARFARAGAAA